MGVKEFQLLMIFWNLGLVDTFNVVKICVNCGSQYLGVILASSVGNSSDIGVKSLVEPILGLGTSYQFVKQVGITAVDRCKRIATLATFLATSMSTLTTDPATNAAFGGAVAAKIAYMKAILARGGDSQIEQYILISSLKDFAITANPLKTPVVTPLLSPAQMQFRW